MSFRFYHAEFYIFKLPRVIVLTTGLILLLGLAGAVPLLQTGDARFIHIFFAYPGAVFLIACSIVQSWISFECWRNFSRGDLLRPAWFLVTISATLQLIGGIVNQILASTSHLNPLLWLPSPASGAIEIAREYGPLFNPLYMFFLMLGLFYVLKACRQSGILSSFRAVDFFLSAAVCAYTINFFATVVFAPHHSISLFNPHRILSWTSDPLLCILLLQAIMIRRSTANMGWGLIARCWFYFTAGIFATSVGDISLWAWSRGYLPEVLQVASWYVWFIAAAAYALGPSYQLQAMLYAKTPDGIARVASQPAILPL